MRGALVLCVAACACATPPRDLHAPPNAASLSAVSAPQATPSTPAPAAIPPSAPSRTPTTQAVAPLVPIGEAPEIDAAVRAAIAAHKLPGAVVAIGHRDAITFLHAYGDRALVPVPEAMTLDTIFDLASLTKPTVTATLVMQLVERGKLALDAPAATYLSELREHGHAAITVRQLLLHTAGLPTENPLRDYDAGPEAGMRAVLASPQLTAAGRVFRYSDVGYLVLGALIERVSGERLDVIAAREVFDPLGMRDTRFRPSAELRPRIAPTEIPDDVRKRIDPEAAHEAAIRGKVHDPRAFRLGGVAGNAGLFSTALDVSRFARALLGAGTLDGARVLSRDGVSQMLTPAFVGEDKLRALGWDVRSEYSGLRGNRLSFRALGHGGYTGTSLWIDPAQDLFVIVLSNRVHPTSSGYVIKLAGEIADHAARRYARTPEPESCAALEGRTQLGIDVLRADGFAALTGKRVALLANAASRAGDGTQTRDVLRAALGERLVALWVPEHGWDRAREGKIEAGRDPDTGLPVRSLFGATRKPSPEMLAEVDAVVFDLQDVGVRFYTYLSTLKLVLEAAAVSGKQVIVLDRPNPLGAERVAGPPLDAGRETFVNYHALPLRHGMTAGELARMLNDERGIGAKLEVIALRGYARELSFARTGIAWQAPSPNLPTLDAVALYPALGLIEGANISVGRGTDTPFAFVGAPWLDATALERALRTSAEPGIDFGVADRTPTRDRFAGQVCHGLLLRVTEPRAFDATRFGFALASALVTQARGELRAPEIGKLLGNQRALDGLLAGRSALELERDWQADLVRFAERRARFLAYSSCDAAAH